MRLLFLSPFPARELRRPSALRRPRLLAAFAAAALVAVAVTPPTVEAQTGDDPIELWKAYPLDPTRRDRDEQSTSARGTPTVPRPPAATTPGAPPRPTADEDAGGRIAVPLVASLAGLVCLIVLGATIVIAHVRGWLRLRAPTFGRRRSSGADSHSVALSAPGLERRPGGSPPPRRLRVCYGCRSRMRRLRRHPGRIVPRPLKPHRRRTRRGERRPFGPRTGGPELA
jgi:hypothetical protein